MDYLLREPRFYVGIIVGMLLLFLKQHFEKKRKDKTAFDSAYTVTKMLTAMRNNEPIDLEVFFPKAGKGRDNTTPGYRAWQGMAFWLAIKYANYEYSKEINDFYRLAKICFGDSTAFTKLKSLDQLLNYSTKYLLNKNGNPYRDREEKDNAALYEMVHLAVDSYDPQVYERSRKC